MQPRPSCLPTRSGEARPPRPDTVAGAPGVVLRHRPGNGRGAAAVVGSVTDIASLLYDEATTVAVVGATDDPGKYGSVIYRDLKSKGYEVYAVNPHRDTVDGDPAYPTLSDLPVKPTIVNVVVPPAETLRVLEQAHEAGIDNAWIQPGAGGAAVIEYLESKGFTYLANACIMVRSRHKAVS